MAVTAQDKNKPHTKQKKRIFYHIAMVIFISFVVLNLGLCLYSGFSDQRVLLMLLNGWFSFYIWDLMLVNDEKTKQQLFWRNWVFFARKQEAPKSQDTPYSLEDDSDDVQNLKKTGTE